MKSYRKRIGDWGEKQAETFLTKNGLQIIDHNFRTIEGEIDLIAQESDEIVFVEVKTRTSNEYGFPEEGMTDEKIDHLSGVVEQYLAKHNDIENWRVDVIAVQGRPGNEKIEIEWFKGIN